MLRLCSLCALAVLALAALAGCGTGAQPTPIPATVTAAPTATVAGAITPAPIGGTPLPVPTMTAGATPSPTTAPPTPSSAPTAAAGLTATTGSAGTAPTETPAMPDETPTSPAPPPEASPTGGAATPAGTPSGVAVDVISFNVWQDFMPSTGTTGPPLNASVELNVTNHGTTALRNILVTRIVIRRPEGEVVLDRGVLSNTPDTDATGDLAPGETRHYSVRAAPSDASPAMTENEAVTGALTLSIDGVEQTVPLPATRVLFTH